MSEQLDSLRKRIDEADRGLLEALAQRMKVVDEILRHSFIEKEELGPRHAVTGLTTEDLKILLVGQKIRLDCGHHCTPGHNLANTLIIISEGGGRIETCCHSCGY